MIVQHNLPALTASNYLVKNNTKLSKVLEKLSSGYRINRAADDAAGLGVSEKMRAQITGLAQAHENSSNGISVVQTAEGALAQTHSILQRMGELAVESMNGVFQAEDRRKLDDEYQQLLDEIDHISRGTNFNGIKLLDGSLERKDGAIARNIRSDIGFRTLFSRAMAQKAPNRLQAITGYSASLFRAPATTIPAGGDFTISGDGVFEIADGFTGKISIAAGSKVTLMQADPSAALENVAIECGAGTELLIQDLNIKNTVDNNLIDFTGSGNKLFLEGINELKRDGGGGAWEKALIHAGKGTELEINGTGSIWCDATGSASRNANGAAIGGDHKQAGGKITINGGKFSNRSSSPSGIVAMAGAFIGSGAYMTGVIDAGTIVINDGEFDLETHGGALIGTGNVLGGSVTPETTLTTGSITINGGKLDLYASGVGAAIGSGGLSMGSPQIRSDLKILITNGEIYATSEYAVAPTTGALIGGGSSVPGGDIRITGGTITGASILQGAGIGGGAYADGGKISVSGGAITLDKLGTGAAIGGGGGCYAHRSPATLTNKQRPGTGATFVMTNGTLDILRGWVGGGKDIDTSDYGQKGTISITGGVANMPTYTPPNNRTHFGTPINIPDADLIVSPSPPLPPIPPLPPLPPDLPDIFLENKVSGGLILQIGTDNAVYDRLHIYIDDMSSEGLMVAGTDILTIDHAEESLDWVHYAIGRVSENRSRLGAYQNRLEHNINSLSIMDENMTAAESRIRDADMAKEMMTFTMTNVLSQAAQSMLAQANQKENEVLSLLK